MYYIRCGTIMTTEHHVYPLDGIKTALRMIEEYRDQLIKAKNNTSPGLGPQSHAVFSYHQLIDSLTDIESAIYGDLEYEDE